MVRSSLAATRGTDVALLPSTRATHTLWAQLSHIAWCRPPFRAPVADCDGAVDRPEHLRSERQPIRTRIAA